MSRLLETFTVAAFIVAASGCMEASKRRPTADAAPCGNSATACGSSCCISGAEECINNACCAAERVCRAGAAAVCCSAGQTCNTSGACVGDCTPHCSGKACGDDGCGGSCGTCAGIQKCNSSGACVSPGFIRGLYIQTNGYWDGSRVKLTSADLEEMKQAGITDVYAQVHFADSSDMGYAASLRPIVQFFKGSGIRVHAWSCPGSYDPRDNSEGSTNQQVIAAVTDVYENDYGVDGVNLDEFWFRGTASKYSNATQYVTDFHKTVFGIVKAHGGIATFCTTPEYAVAESVYGVDHAAIGQYCDYITPMAYVGDFGASGPSWVGKVVDGIQAQTTTTVFPVLESYESDRNVTPKPVEDLNAEAESGISAGAPGFALFRFGLLSGYPTAGPQ